MSQKQENLLQLALQTPEEVRERTEDLNVGFDSTSKTWELIVKYHGSLDELTNQNIAVETLIAGYAILTVPEKLVEQVTALEQIEYVEMPKRFFYDAVNPAEEACMPQLRRRDLLLSGKSVLMAVLDSGINYRLPEFRRADGSTRILWLWDQTIRYAQPPDGFAIGQEFSEEDINRALEEDNFESVPSFDGSGHGTAVAGIAAGSSGVAYEAELLIVKLGVPDIRSFPRTTEIMRGVTWAIRKALEKNQPLVINLSFGNSYGAHDGGSLLERFLDNASEIGRTVICVGSGNEASSGGHLSGNLMKNESALAELAVANYQSGLNIQLWKNYSDEFRIRLRSPGGRETVLPETVYGVKFTLQLEDTIIYVFLGEPKPYSTAQEIYLEMLPATGRYINSGVWEIVLEAVRIVSGQYYFYLPVSEARSEGTGFYRSNPEMTLTIPSTAAKVITVGAYNSTFDSYADFSGRGYADAGRTIGVVAAGLSKPDLAAPGVGVIAPTVNGDFQPFTGTSFATPIVSGSAALLMEWGIVRGNDLFLYGEKVKAYLRRGALPLRGEQLYPNSRVGWGKLCVEASIP